MTFKASERPAETGSDLDSLPSWHAAALRVTLWLSASVGAAVCFYWAALEDPAYWWPGVALTFLAVWPVVRSTRDPLPVRTRLNVHAHGLRLTHARGLGVSARSLAWQDVERVEVHTPPAPFRGADLRFVLVMLDGGGDVEVTAETARDAGLWLALETYLGDLDEKLMLRALGARESRRFVVWQRAHAEVTGTRERALPA